MIRPLVLATTLLLLATSPLLEPRALAQDPHRQVLTRPALQYPELARRMHVGGTVIVEALIRPDGTVAQAKAQSGHALLTFAAESSVRQWHFAPAPDSSQAIVSVNFAMDLKN